jgi:Holliday junction resolvase RusA-like endonuclease
MTTYPRVLMDDLHLSLPLPPSVNALYANVRGRGRCLTAVGRHWHAAASAHLVAARCAAKATGPDIWMPGPVMVHVVFTFQNPRSDIDGPLKPLLDILVDMRVIDDDRYVMQLSVRKEIGPAKCEVCVRQAMTATSRPAVTSP